MRNKEFTIGAILQYAMIALNIISGIVYAPWILRMIGDNDYAIYTIVSSLISLFLVDFGISNAVSKFVSDYVTDKKYHEIENFMGLVYKLYFIIDLIILVVLIVVYCNIEQIYATYGAEQIHKLKVVYAIVGACSILQFPFIGLYGILISYERFVFDNCIGIIAKILTIIITVFLLFNGGRVYEFVLVNSMVGLLVFGLRYVYIKYRLKLKANMSYWDRNLVKKLFSYSIWITVITLVSRLFYNIAPTILARTGTSLDVNIFSFASTLEGYVWIIGTAIYGMFILRITALSKGDDPDAKMFYVMKENGRFQLLLIGLIAVGWICVGETFIREIWLGERYRLVYVSAIILILPDLLILPQQIAETILIVKDKIYLQAVAFTIAALTNLVLSIFLAQLWGEIGICISIMICNCFKFILLNYFYYKGVHIDILGFARDVYLKIVPFQVAVLCFGMIINRFYDGLGIVGFLVKAIVICMAYLGGAYFCVLSNDEKKQFLKKGSE